MAKGSAKAASMIIEPAPGSSVSFSTYASMLMSSAIDRSKIADGHRARLTETGHFVERGNRVVWRNRGAGDG